jgi:Tfp pilus assembly protein PilN
VIEINLLPGAKRKRGGKGFHIALPDVKALAGLAKDPWLIAGIVSWALVALLVTPLFLRSRSQVAALGPRLEAAQREERRYAALVTRKRQFEAIRDSLISEIDIIKGIDKDRYVWPHVLDAVTKALPPYTWLDNLESRGGETDSGGVPSFQITGKAVDPQAFTRFLRNLEESPFIEGVAPVSTGIVQEQGRDVTTFIITARFQVPDSTLLTWQPLAATVVQGVRSGGGVRR